MEAYKISPLFTTRLNNQLSSKVLSIGIDTHQYYDKSTWNRIESKILGIAHPYTHQGGI